MAAVDPAPAIAHARAVRMIIGEEARNLVIMRNIVIGVSIFNCVKIIINAIFMGLFWKQTCSVNIQLWLLLYTIYEMVFIAVRLYRYYYDITEIIMNQPNHMMLNRICNMLIFANIGLVISGIMMFYKRDLDCANDSKYLYELCFVLITYELFLIVLPFILCMLTCFCLPCLICFLARVGPNQGASRDEINQLETKKCTVVAEEYSCAICLDDYKINDNIRVLPCKHEYHVNCIDEWLVINSTCPSCRRNIHDRLV